MERVLGGDADMGSHMAPDCGLPWVQFWYDDTVIFYDPTTGKYSYSVLPGGCVVRAMTGDGRVVAENRLTPGEGAYLIGPAEALQTSLEAFQPLRWADAP